MLNTTTCSSQVTVGGKPLRTTATLKLPMYSCRVVLVIAEHVAAEATKLIKKHKLEMEFEGDAEGTVITPDIDLYYLVIGSKYITHNTLSHELYHVVKAVLRDRGIGDEEAGAWLMGHLTEFVYKTLDKKKYQVKHG